MKPLEHIPLAQAQAGLQTERQESQIAQRLWQLLLALPEHERMTQTQATAAAPSSSGLPEGTHTPRDEERDASGQLASAAHVLAGAVHQLGIVRYTQPTGQQPQAAQHPVQHAPVQLQLTDVGAHGGTARLSIAHPQLGDIQLEVQLQGGSVRVVASAPNEHAARILEAGQAVLAERLAQQGVALDALDVVVARKRSQRPNKRGRSSTRARAAKEER